VEIISLAPVAKATLLANDMDVSISCSLLLTFYAATEKLEKNKKDECVSQLSRDMESSQGDICNGP
jgi:hypothetical protein